MALVFRPLRRGGAKRRPRWRRYLVRSRSTLPRPVLRCRDGAAYNYFRDYDPAIGRYVQSDPIGLAGGLSTYLYANANPNRYADPEGLIAPAVWGAAVAYARCLAECAAIEAAIAALGPACPPGLAGVAATCAADCLNPLNWLPGSKIFQKGKKARDALKRLDRAEDAIDAGRTSRAARREAMRREGIPTSQQPTSQSRNTSGREYTYDTPKPGGGTQTKSVQQQTMDSSHPGESHWEAGTVKTDPLTGETRMNQYGRPKLTNDKSKVGYE